MISLQASEALPAPSNCAQTSGIICCYSRDRWNDLCAAIDSLRTQSPALREIIVVVDHNEALEGEVRDRFPDIVVIPNSLARGLSGARNCGARRASGSYLLFLDDDATLEDSQLLPLLENFEDPRVVGVSPMVKPKWTSQPPDWFPSEYLWVIGCTHKGVSPGPVRNLLGACMVLLRDDVLAAGGFDSSLGRTTSVLPMGGEETEICLRIKKLKPRGLFVYDNCVYASHTAHTQRLTPKYLLLRCFAEGLSKARIVSLMGRGAGLSTERAYVWRTLTRSSMVRLARFATRFDSASLFQFCVMWAGFVATASGYAVGRLQAISGFTRGGIAQTGSDESAAAHPADTLK